MSQDSECLLALIASQRDHRRCVLGSKSCKDAKSRLPKLLKLANGLGNLSSSDVRDRIFSPLGRARYNFFTGAKGQGLRGRGSKSAGYGKAMALGHFVMKLS